MTRKINIGDRKYFLKGDFGQIETILPNDPKSKRQL